MTDKSIMLLPDLGNLMKWVGYRSLGAMLVDKNSKDRELLAAEHKILYDLRDGKRVSIERIEKLMAAIISKWRPDTKVNRADVLAQLLKSQHGEAPYIQIDFDREGTLIFWGILAGYLSEKPKTQLVLGKLIQFSKQMHDIHQRGGIEAVALFLNKIAEHPSTGIAKRRFLAKIVQLINNGKEDVARIELASFGALLVSAAFLTEGEHSVEAPRKSLTGLFVADQGLVNPLLCFSHWLERLEARTGYSKDRLLLDGFVHPRGETMTSSEQDPRDGLRNARRYRSGALVPSFDQTKVCLHSLRPEFTENERETWEAELERRETSALFVLLVANSARSIKRIGGVPERPCQAVYDLLAQGAGS